MEWCRDDVVEAIGIERGIARPDKFTIRIGVGLSAEAEFECGIRREGLDARCPRIRIQLNSASPL